MAQRKEAMLAVFAVHEARSGHVAPLIGRVLSGAQLTDDEREFIAAALERLDGKRGKAELRQIEKTLIAMRVEGLITEEGFSTEAAVARVMQERDRSRAFVFAAISESKKRK
jgi:hypothetical protein